MNCENEHQREVGLLNVPARDGVKVSGKFTCSKEALLNDACFLRLYFIACVSAGVRMGKFDQIYLSSVTYECRLWEVSLTSD